MAQQPDFNDVATKAAAEAGQRPDAGIAPAKATAVQAAEKAAMPTLFGATRLRAVQD